MKHLPLKAVMAGLEIIETDGGYELHSPAGKAKYDVWGARREVIGIPEYFPSSISMKKRLSTASVDKGSEKIALSAAATDVLYALFFRGALHSDDLPAKSGAAELRELGFAETRHTATEYQKENYFTFLTSEGQQFAMEHLVNTRFGMPVGGYIGISLDALAELSPFTMKNGQVFINDACTRNGITSESGRIYASGMGVSVDNGKEQVEAEAEKFEIAASSKGPLDSALQEAIKKIVNEAMQKATQPGGLLHSRK